MSLVSLLPDHMQEIQQVRERIQQLQSDNNDMDPIDVEELRDVDILRFLKARQYDIDVATELLASSLRWRLKVEVKKVQYKDTYSEIVKEKVLIPGYDKERRLICLVKVRLHFPSSSVKKVMEKMILFMMEKCRSKLDPDVETFDLIFDLSGFSLSNMDYDLVKYLLKIFSDYYPETLGMCLVVNSPWLFKGCWAIVKPWMDPVTSSKILFVNSNKLLEYIDESVLPEDLGGSNTDLVNHGLDLTDEDLNFDR